MKASTIALAGLLFVLTGCAVHDGHEGEPAPIWWPAFLYREQPTSPTTQASIGGGGSGSVGGGGSAGGVEATTARPAAYVSTPQDVRRDWNLSYGQPEVTAVPASDNLTLAPPNHQPPATLYPNRGEAAQGANSATLYPPTNTFVTDPGRNPSVYPRSPAGPTGYTGR